MMLFKLKPTTNKKIEKMYKKSMVNLKNFFSLNWKYNPPNVFLVLDRKTIDKLKREKTEKWVVGWASESNIFLLDPKNYEKESLHKYSKEEYFSLLKHELCHTFFNIISKGNSNPIWINEGVCIFLSGQNKFKKKIEKFSKFLDFYNKGGKEVYYESGFAIELLVKKFGKQKLLALIKSLSKTKNKTQFNKEFKTIYNSNPSYKFFNKMLK